jgi:MFS transporter, SP family, sugar:H+ symporter
MALSTASNWLWNFLLAFFTPFITSAIDFRYGYVFAGTNVIGGLLVYFFVIEGQGRTLEEIDIMYLMGVKPWESAKWVVPSIEELDGKMKERLAATNPEMAARTESIGGVGGAGGVANGTTDGGIRAAEHDREGSEDNLKEKEKENGV